MNEKKIIDDLKSIKEIKIDDAFFFYEEKYIFDKGKNEWREFKGIGISMKDLQRNYDNLAQMLKRIIEIAEKHHAKVEVLESEDYGTLLYLDLDNENEAERV